VPAGVELRWVPRDAARASGDPHGRVPGRLALETVRAADLPSGPVYAYGVGESSLATGVRRHPVGDRGVPKANVDFVGYWRHGRAATAWGGRRRASLPGPGASPRERADAAQLLEQRAVERVARREPDAVEVPHDDAVGLHERGLRVGQAEVRAVLA